MPPIVMLIKPASSLCNMNCQYCFYLDTAKNRDVASYGLMSEETLENAVKKGFDFAQGSISFAFQGGEPMLAGLSFFEKFIELEKKHSRPNLDISHCIQTNATLIDEKFAKFFHDNNFLVGVSLDGPKQFHDTYRKFSDSTGSFNKVMNGISLLKKHEVEFNILCVVNRITAKNIKKIYEFYKSNDFLYLQFIPCLQPFGLELKKLPFTLTAKDWGKFLCELFDLWLEDLKKGKPVYIREFENYIQMLIGYAPESCSMGGICSFQNVIESDGSCYPCDFYVLDKYRLGNVNDDDFINIYKVRQELNFVQDSAKINQKCLKCKYFKLCRGGCKRLCEPFNENNERSLNILCQGYKQFFDYSHVKLEKIAAEIKNNIQNK